MQTSVYRIDKKQGPAVEHGELYSQHLMINHNGKEYEKDCIYMNN